MLENRNVFVAIDGPNQREIKKQNEEAGFQYVLLIDKFPYLYTFTWFLKGNHWYKSVILGFEINFPSYSGSQHSLSR